MKNVSVDLAKVHGYSLSNVGYFLGFDHYPVFQKMSNSVLSRERGGVREYFLKPDSKQGAW